MLQWLRAVLLGLMLLAATLAVVAIRVFRIARRRRPTRSLWSGAPLPTLAVNARAERRLGVEARSLVYETYVVTDAFDHNLESLRRLPLAGRLVALGTFLWASWRFDRFHFYCDRGLLPGFNPGRVNPWELILHRFLGKEVFFWTYGADVRTRARTEALGRPNACMHCPRPGRACICSEDAAAINQRRLARRACAVFSMGDMIHYTPGSHNEVFYWPVDLDADGGRRYAPCYPASDSTAPLRVVHAPNHRAFKGTRYLIEAVDRLNARRTLVELVIVEGVPNAEALRIYRTADVMFDQCLIGFHGYFAQEAMAIGKPVMCFIRDPRRALLHPEECPILNTPPERIESVLRELAGARHRLPDLGRRGRAYIERYHTPARFAERLRLAYEHLGVRPA